MRALVERAEERGYVEPAELEAYALEHELNDQDVEELTRELERTGLEIGVPAAQSGDSAKAKAPPTRMRTRTRSPSRRR